GVSRCATGPPRTPMVSGLFVACPPPPLGPREPVDLRPASPRQSATTPMLATARTARPSLRVGRFRGYVQMPVPRPCRREGCPCSRVETANRVRSARIVPRHCSDDAGNLSIRLEILPAEPLRVKTTLSVVSCQLSVVSCEFAQAA